MVSSSHGVRLSTLFSEEMSKSIAPKLHQFARRLVAHEAASRRPAKGKGSRTFFVCEKLRGPLGQLTGRGGFRSVLSRALALAGEEVPWLRGLHVRADGSLEDLDELEVNLGPEEIALGEVILVARLLGLLVTFIGPTLTLELLQHIWPKMEGLNL